MKRWRTAIGSIAILVFLAFYVWAAMMLGQKLPDNGLFRLTYYVIAGALWAAPIFPLLSWMAKDDRGPRT